VTKSRNQNRAIAFIENGHPKTVNERPKVANAIVFIENGHPKAANGCAEIENECAKVTNAIAQTVNGTAKSVESIAEMGNAIARLQAELGLSQALLHQRCSHHGMKIRLAPR
jgi:hypothetical protein